MENSNREAYECKDLMLSAALLASGIPLLGIQKKERYLTFVFGDPERSKLIENEWWAGTLKVVATNYAEAIKRLKGMIYAQKV